MSEAAFPPGPGPDATYREFLAEGRFRIQRCTTCTAHIFPPRQLCPECGGTVLIWVDATGQGTVYAVTVVNRREEDGGPYNVVLVDLLEGPRMMSRVENIAPADVAIGMPVQARIIDNEQFGPHIVFDLTVQGAVPAEEDTL